ncbi:MAG: PaaI family thioesterase [Candidatus Hodarchaeota archaeon]
MPDNNDQIKKRSERMLKLFKDFLNKELKDLPVPPFTKWLNGKLIRAEYGLLEVEFKIRPEMANPTGLLHGGMQCALMDDVVGMTTATLGYEGFPISIDFHVDFLGKVRVGEKVRVIGKVIREGRNILHMVAEIYDLNNKLISTGNSNLFRTHFIPDYIKQADNTH